MKSTRYITCAILALSSLAFSAPKQAEEKPMSPQQCKAQQAQGEPLMEKCSHPGFNAPAAISVRNKTDRYNLENKTAFIQASFTYWYAGEEGLKLASTAAVNAGILYYVPNAHTLQQSFDYKPGFKIRAGVIDKHESMLYADYTWFRGTSSKHSGASLDGTVSTAGTTTTTGTAVWAVDDWFLQGTTSGQALAASSLSSKWHLSMDLVDLLASRPFYQGRKVTVAPFAGLELALIRQSMNVQITESTALLTSGLPTLAASQPIYSRNHSNSWAIGPKVGCSSQCLLPMGFRFEGDVAASLLYTKYTSVKHSESIASTGFNPGPYTVSMNSYTCMRPMAELGLGFGWGKYLGGKNYHIDFSADYDFMMFWSQNMMRKLLDDTLTGTSPSPADLYVQGLTVTGRFDF